MRNFFTVLLFLVAYCTPFVIITVPVMVIASAVRNYKAHRIYREKHPFENELPPPERNTHFGVDL